jgi:hypothetical protein
VRASGDEPHVRAEPHFPRRPLSDLLYSPRAAILNPGTGADPANIAFGSGPSYELLWLSGSSRFRESGMFKPLVGLVLSNSL